LKKITFLIKCITSFLGWLAYIWLSNQLLSLFMTKFFVIPGLGNSGPEHWQTYFEKSGSNFKRINQNEWDNPVCSEWIRRIDNVLKNEDLSNVVLIGHSLGCLTIAHWANVYKRKIKGALLVAPSDAESAHYTFPAEGFSPIPLELINFKTIVVASSNDQWVSLERATLFAKSWGSELINIGNTGHINTASGFGNWEEGLAILKTNFTFE
jgi:uncharacterized protein